MKVTPFPCHHPTHGEGIGGASGDACGCWLYVFVGHFRGHRTKYSGQLIALVRRYDQCRSGELIGGLCQLRQGRGLHLDTVGCGDGQIVGECHQEVADVGMVVELLVEDGEGCGIDWRRRLYSNNLR